MKKILNLSNRLPDPFLLTFTVDPDIGIKSNVQTRVVSAERIFLQELLILHKDITETQAEEMFVTLKSLETMRF